ncbi:MAG: DUF1684 domain-containing protein [Balneolaceae bacterium]|nr:DUF1684 domain-containing protein [Balneolaceae bacterium]
MIKTTLKNLTLGLLAFGMAMPVLAQKNDRVITREIQHYRDSLNTAFKNPDKSPLLPDDFKAFDSLSVFPANTDYYIRAKFVRTPNQEPFRMATTSPDRNPWYEKYGEAHFDLNGNNISVNIYQSHELRKTEKYRNYLFLPFRDKTNGNTTYGGGRYVELSIPKGDSITIGFNKAYNPYCAYNASYACPLVPVDNHLSIEVPTGVKAFKTKKKK